MSLYVLLISSTDDKMRHLTYHIEADWFRSYQNE